MNMANYIRRIGKERCQGTSFVFMPLMEDKKYLVCYFIAELSRVKGPLAKLHAHTTTPVSFHGHG